MAPKTPPQDPPSFGLTPSSLILEAHSIITTTKALEDRLAASITPETATFANLVVPLTADDTASRARTSILTLPASVSPDATLRDAAREAQVLLSKACTESLARLDIATLVAAVHERYKAGEEDLDPESGHLLEKTYGQYARNGLTLGEGEKRARFLEMKEELQGVLTAAKRTLTEADDGVWLTRAELDGVPDSVLAQLEREDREGEETFRVTFRQGHYRPVMQNATRADTRRRMYLGDAHRFPENVERLESAVRLRDEISRVLGYENYAALRMEDKMSESVEEVLELLGDVKTRLAPLADAEIEGMLALKRDDLRERGDAEEEEEEEDGDLHFWDWAFYNRKLKRERYAVDTARIAEYFEVENTLRGMLSIFERLFGLEFRREGVCEAWHEDVVLYTVWDSEEQGGEFLGYLYMDIFARAGKYAGAHHVSIVPGIVESRECGPRRYQVSALVCNFNRPSAERPTLLQHLEVKTLFHELGHAIHYLVSRTKYAMGFSRDFVEIPSIVLENWIWVPDVLAGLGRHYSLLSDGYRRHWEAEQGRSGGEAAEPEAELPRRLAEDLVRSRTVNGAHDMLHQVQLALFDLTIHTGRGYASVKDIDLTRLWNEGMQETMRLRGLIDPVTGEMRGWDQAGFGHIFRAYDAGYFAYALARIVAADLYASTFAGNPMDPATGQRYRRGFLQHGAGRPEAETLRAFLGRRPSSAAYFEALAHGATVPVPGL